MFQLFLPIVVFIFQLWFLLTLRFCIPPDVDLSGSFGAELNALGGGLNIDAGAVGAVTGDPVFDQRMNDLVGGTTHKGQTMADAIKQAATLPAGSPGSIDRRSYGSLLRGMFAGGTAPPRPLAYVQRVERSEVVRP